MAEISVPVFQDIDVPPLTIPLGVRTRSLIFFKSPCVPNKPPLVCKNIHYQLTIPVNYSSILLNLAYSYISLHSDLTLFDIQSISPLCVESKESIK